MTENLTRTVALAQGLLQALKENDLTESTMMKEIDEITVNLMKLEDLGIDILIDDFGTGVTVKKNDTVFAYLSDTINWKLD